MFQFILFEIKLWLIEMKYPPSHPLSAFDLKIYDDDHDVNEIW